jgi:multidrug resistance efflux pump
VVTAAPRMSHLNAAGVVEPLAEATLSTKLMGTITAVLVQEGDVVRAGQPLLRIDARDLNAKRAQVEAGQAEAQACCVRRKCTRAGCARSMPTARTACATRRRPRRVYNRALAGVAAAGAGAAELAAVSSYSEITRAVRRHGRRAHGGSRQLRGAGRAAARASGRREAARQASARAGRSARPRSRCQQVTAVIEGEPASATVEGVVPGRRQPVHGERHRRQPVTACCLPPVARRRCATAALRDRSVVPRRP